MITIVRQSAGHACSATGAPGTAGTAEPTGTVTAAIAQVPLNVKCVVLYSTDPSTPSVARDVTPGAVNTTLQIGPLATGVVTIRGEAFAVPCAARTTDGGASQLTWEAPWVPVNLVRSVQRVLEVRSLEVPGG